MITHRVYKRYKGSGRRKRPQAARPSRGAVAAAVCFVLAFLALVAVVCYPDIKAPLSHAAQTAAQEAAELLSTPAPSTGPSGPETLDALEVWVLDVGQGDCIFLRAPGGETMLVDSGDYEHREVLKDFLTAQQVSSLDVGVASHPHSDHIGNMAWAVRHYSPKSFWMPEAENDSVSYENLITTLAKKKTATHYAYAGESAEIPWAENVTVRVLSPFRDVGYLDLNSYSIILNVRYGDTAILLAGDASTYAENLSMSVLPLSYFRADVIKIAHHGSSDATSREFLAAVSPRYAAISVGANNGFGHPHTSVLKSLQRQGTAVFRTDQRGTLHFRLDGQRVFVSCEK